MDDGDSKNIQQIKRKGKTYTNIKRPVLNVGSFLQSFWIRCRSIFPNSTDGKFMEGELRIVLYCGILFWILHLLYQTFK